MVSRLQVRSGIGAPPSSQNSARRQQIKPYCLNNLESVMKAVVYVSSIVALLGRLIPLTQAASAAALTDVWGPTDSHTRTVVRIAGERNSGVRRRPEASGDHGISYRGLPESTG